MELLFSCALITQYTICSRFNSWVAEAMGVKYLAQGNISSRGPQLGIEPGTLQLPGRCPGSFPLPPYISIYKSIEGFTYSLFRWEC